MSSFAFRFFEIWRNPLPVHPDNQVRRALAVVAELVAFRGANQLGNFIARRLLGCRHELQANEMGRIRRQDHIATSVVPGDQHLSQFLFVVPSTRHVPYLFYLA